jgi:hypothetical protein
MVIVKQQDGDKKKRKKSLTKWSPGADGRAHAADLAGGEEVAVFLQPLQHVQTRLVAVKNGLELSANLQHEQGVNAMILKKFRREKNFQFF